MKRRKNNIHAHELLGMEAKVLDKKGSEIAEGIIIDETKELIIMKKEGKIKKFLKRSHDFLFEIEGEKIKLKGNSLIGRPEDRVKKI